MKDKLSKQKIVTGGCTVSFILKTEQLEFASTLKNEVH